MAKVRSLKNPETARWDRKLSQSDCNKMLKGFIPEDMDGKWMYRSWRSIEHFSLSIEASIPGETEADKSAAIVGIAWDKHTGQQEITEGEIKSLALVVCRKFLGCEFEKS